MKAKPDIEADHASNIIINNFVVLKELPPGIASLLERALVTLSEKGLTNE